MVDHALGFRYMTRFERLPLFPLGLVLYPSEQVPLHIFEARYRKMMRYCLENDAVFGIIFFDEGKMAEVGCTARITRILERYEDGRMDMLVTGEQRFRVLNMYDDEPYLTADAEALDESDEPVQKDVQQRLITQHMRLLELAGRTVRPNLYDYELNLSYIIAPNAGLTPQQKQEVLELQKENQRMEFLINHLESLIPQVERIEEIRRKIQSNGHFKDFPPKNMTE